MWNRLKKIIKSSRKEKKKEIDLTLHPHEVFLILKEIEEEKRNKILSQLSFKELLRVLPELPSKMGADFINSLSLQKDAKLLSNIPSDETVDILQNVSARKRKEILKIFDKSKEKEIRSLLKYSPQTAGGLITTEFIALNKDFSVREAIKSIREDKKEYPVYYVYIVDDEKRLVGILSLRQIILAHSEDKLENIMKKEIIKTTPEVDQERVAKIINDYNLVAIPVVDQEDKILGIITVDDAMEVMEEETTEDIAAMAGIIPAESLADISSVQRVKSRIPWLIVGLLGGIIAAQIVGLFEHILSSYLTLAMFMPVLVYMSDATSTQSTTIIIRAMALEPRFKIKKYLLKEIKTGIMIAIICGSIISLVLTFGWGSSIFGFIIGFSMFLSIIFAIFFASFLPYLFKKINIDPALAVGPFATIIIDLVTLFIYFGVASLMTGYLM